MRDAPVKTTAFQQGINVTSATAKEKIGTLRILEDGTKFRYSKAGGVLAAGKVTVAAQIAAAHIDATVTAVNNNGTQAEITVTAGTAIVENALSGGYLHVNDGTLEGNRYRIDSNTAIDASGTVVTISTVDRITGYDGTTQVTLVHNPWSGVTHSAVEENLCTGIPPVAVASGRYFWNQTGGPAVCLVAGTPAVGSMLTMSSTAGALAPISSTLDIDQPVVGVAFGTAGVSTEYKPVMLNID